MSRHKGIDIGERRFAEGDRFHEGGIRFRVERGRKTDDDLRIDWYVAESGQWVAIPMSVLFLLVDFFWENEHVIYPPSRGYQGGEKFWQALRGSWLHGWKSSQDGLAAERRQRELRACQPGLFDTYSEATS
jgi:hypothetical protein